MPFSYIASFVDGSVSLFLITSFVDDSVCLVLSCLALVWLHLWCRVVSFVLSCLVLSYLVWFDLVLVLSTLSSLSPVF